jgi:hypothetical protein
MTNKQRFGNIEISLKDDEGNVVHSVPLKAGFSSEAAMEVKAIHNVDIVDEITNTLVQELNFKYEPDDRTQLQEVMKELVQESLKFTKNSHEKSK